MSYNLPNEIVNLILSYRGPHPIVECMKNAIKEYIFIYNFKRKSFSKYYFSNEKIFKQKENTERYIEYLDWTFKTMKGSNEDKVKFFYHSKLEKKRLNEKLKELNIACYEVSTTTHFPRKNKYGNFSEAYYKGKEIIF